MNQINDKTITYYTVGRKADFLPRIGRIVKLGEQDIVVFRTAEDHFYALENKSPHPKGGTLAEGMVSGETLFDPLYDWKIGLKDGVVKAPETGSVQTYPVQVVEDEVRIGV